MKKSVKGLAVTLLFAFVLNAIVFVPSVSAVENLPTVWVKVYRIQTVDSIETGLEGEADWRYMIAVTDGETTVTREFKCKSNIGDNIVDRLDSFPDIHSKSVQVTITVYEDDSGGYETADVSSSGMSLLTENTTRHLATMTAACKQMKMMQICGLPFLTTMKFLSPTLAMTRQFTQERQ